MAAQELEVVISLSRGRILLPQYNIIETYAAGFDKALQECRLIQARRNAEIATFGRSELTPFDPRSRMYGWALRASPEARKVDEGFALSWLDLKRGERGMDIGTGTGMFARIFAPVTRNTVIGLDTSREQLEQARKAVELESLFHAKRFKTTPREYTKLFQWVQQSPADANLNFTGLDYIFTFGCIHHLNWGEQRKMMENIADWLKPTNKEKGGGRFIGADIAEGSPLATYFRGHVDKLSFTGHKENFFTSEEHIKKLLEGLPLRLRKVMGILQFWKFGMVEGDRDRVEMGIVKLGWFLSALHGIDKPIPEVVIAAHNALGFVYDTGKPLYLYWPMLAWDIRRI